MVILTLPEGARPGTQQVIQCAVRDDKDRQYPFTPVCLAFVDQWEGRGLAAVHLSVEAAKDLRSQLDFLLLKDET